MKRARKRSSPPPRFEGPETAPLTVTMYADFECPASARAFQGLSALRYLLGDDVRLELRHFPLRQEHSHAERAALAAEVARLRDRFWSMATLLFQNQGHLSETALANLAEMLGIEREEFEMDLAAGAGRERVEDDLIEGRRLGVEKTPALFFNGKRYRGKTTFPDLGHAVLKALERALGVGRAA